jgi:hypothetical protein
MGPEKSASEEFIVLATFGSRRSAERAVASLGRTFRRAARKGHASALVLSANPDGSLKLTQSRAESASDLTAMLIRLSLALVMGFLGIISMLKGTKETGHAARTHEGHVGSDETRAHEILAEAGPKAGLLPVRCPSQQVFEKVSAHVAERAVDKWQGARKEFLDAVDPGSQYDWVRKAVGERTS